MFMPTEPKLNSQNIESKNYLKSMNVNKWTDVLEDIAQSSLMPFEKKLQQRAI